MTRNILTLTEARALVRAADLIQDEKHKQGGLAMQCETADDFDGARSHRYASYALQRVEDKLRAEAAPRAPAEPEAKVGEPWPGYCPKHNVSGPHYCEPEAKADKWRCSCKRDPQYDAVIAWDPDCALHGAPECK